MSGIFGVTAKQSCVEDLFFGIDYHSHLGTKKGGMAVYGEEGFNRSIHNIASSPFRTKFEKDIEDMHGNMGIGCISDNEPQPLLVNSHLGSFAIVTVGVVNNLQELVQEAFDRGHTHFLEMSGGEVNQTELVASLINQKDSIVEGIHYAQSKIKGSMTLMIMNSLGIYLARDKLGRTPLNIGYKESAYCASFESFAYLNLGYSFYKELGPGEIDFMTNDGVKVLSPANDKMKLCTFLYVYYGYPTSCYEGVNVEQMRYRCGEKMACRDNVDVDLVAGVPDSGIAYAIGYSNQSKVNYGRPFIKYTPTWPRSFMPPRQIDRNLIAKMKLVPIVELVKNKSLLLIDDSIVRGTQLRDSADFLFKSGAREVHVRPGCPPVMFSCKYLNFSRSTSDMDLITRRMIMKREGPDAPLDEYCDPDNLRYQQMVEDIRQELNFTSLSYNRLDDMMDSIGIDPECLCTYCWTGKED